MNPNTHRDDSFGSRDDLDPSYSDASYRRSYSSCGTYGYSPTRSYAQADDGASPGKPHLSAGMLLSVCLMCIFISGILGIGGTLLAFHRQALLSNEETAAVQELYEALAAEALSYESSETILFLDQSSAEGLDTLSPEEIYLDACQSTVGVIIPGQSANIFGQSSSRTVSGSGLILSENGYVLTNYHVIEPAYTGGTPIQIVTYDGTEYIANVVGIETDSDLAVLKIDAMDLQAAALGNSDEMRVGQAVYAIGNPLGELTYTMTSGIVSALNRSITTDINVTVNMFQIDAAVNNGNSGGPVYNAYGQVIGIVTAKYSQNGMEGLGFAIPVNDVYTIANELIANGYVSGKAYLGLTLTTVSASVARYYNMVPGVYVYSVEPDSCSQQAGLRTGDIITAIDGQEVLEKSDLLSAVKEYKAGDSADLTVYRNQAYTIITVVFDEELPAEHKTMEDILMESQYPKAGESVSGEASAATSQDPTA